MIAVALTLTITLATAQEDDKVKATKYLEKYGYIDLIEDRSYDGASSYNAGLENFQDFNGLEVTGKLDEET